MDISGTLAPKSDQLDAVDLLGGPRTFTITAVTKGSTEQPVQVHLAEFDRVWRPGKSMRRVLAAAWGTDGKAWVGRMVTLYCDPSVQFGGEAVGGSRISHLSHIDGPLQVPLLVKRGKSAVVTVQPLTIDLLRGQWQGATPEGRAQIQAQVAALTNSESAVNVARAADSPGAGIEGDASGGPLSADAHRPLTGEASPAADSDTIDAAGPNFAKGDA